MDVNTWLLSAGLAIALGALVSTVYLRWLEVRSRMNESRYRLERELRAEDYSSISHGREVSTDRALRDLRAQVRSQTKLLEALAAKETIANVSSESAPSQLPKDAGESAPQISADARGAELLVREISHSLNTPLSQIEIALSLLGSNSTLSAADEEAVARAATSVAISKAFIQAFRLVSGGEMAEEDQHQLQDLSVLVSRAAGVLGAQDGQVTVELPTQVGYRPTFILAMLTPLLENAIEASSEGGEVRVWASASSAAIALHVGNRLTQPLPEGLYRPGHSGKPDHEGLGLAVVKRLVRSVPGATLAHEITGDLITFSITLPANETSEEPSE